MYWVSKQGKAKKVPQSGWPCVYVVGLKCVPNFPNALFNITSKVHRWKHESIVL